MKTGISQFKPVSSKAMIAFVMMGLSLGKYDIATISKISALSLPSLEQYLSDYKNIPGEIADRICYAVYGPSANIVWHTDVVKSVALIPAYEQKSSELDRLLRQNDELRAHYKLPRHLQMVRANKRAGEILEKYHAAGYDTLEKFRNAVLAVYPEKKISELSNYWLFFDCEYYHSFEIEHALEVLLSAKQKTA